MRSTPVTIAQAPTATVSSTADRPGAISTRMPNSTEATPSSVSQVRERWRPDGSGSPRAACTSDATPSKIAQTAMKVRTKRMPGARIEQHQQAEKDAGDPAQQEQPPALGQRLRRLGAGGLVTRHDRGLAHAGLLCSPCRAIKADKAPPRPGVADPAAVPDVAAKPPPGETTMLKRRTLIAAGLALPAAARAQAPAWPQRPGPHHRALRPRRVGRCRRALPGGAAAGRARPARGDREPARRRRGRSAPTRSRRRRPTATRCC